MNKPADVHTVTYSSLASELRRKDGRNYGLFFASFDSLPSEVAERKYGSPYYSFVDELKRGQKWKAMGQNRYSIGSSAYVKLRKQGGRWVIDEIGRPES